MEKKSLKLKADNNNVNFPTQFCLWLICNGFSATESIEVSLNGNVYDLSVDYDSVDKSDILINMNLVELKYYPFMINYINVLEFVTSYLQKYVLQKTHITKHLIW